MPTIINLDNHAIMSVKRNGNDDIFIIKYNENKFVESVSIYSNNKLSELDIFSEFIKSRNIHIDDMNDEMIKLIMDFNTAWFYLECAVNSAHEHRRYAKIFDLK